MIYIADQTQITRDWKFVKQRIETCLNASGEGVTIFDVYHLLRVNAAFLLVSRDTEGCVDACATLTIVSPPMHPEIRSLHIWHANSDSGVASAAALKVIKDFAKSSSCSVVTLKGVQPAFERWGRNLGFRRVCTEFKLEI